MSYYLCECDYRTSFCGRTMPDKVYLILSKTQLAGDDLYIVYKDHTGGDEVIQREGEWVLVRAVEGEE